MNAPLYPLIYTSRATPSMTALELQQIIAAARTRNASEQITGILLHSDGQFMQVIEGGRAAVERLQARLALDPHHEDMRVIYAHEVAQRDLSHWDMALREQPPDQLSAGSALSQFLQPDFDVRALGYGSPVGFLLQSFGELHV